MSGLEFFVERIQAAVAARTPLRLRGAGSKDWYGSLLAGEVLETGGYSGLVAYAPEELCLTARCGTPLTEIEDVLAERGQMLPFEPPHFGKATFGGMLAAGLAGPRRQQAGGVRDAILGVRLVDGRGDVLNFGGQVVKNVAGYDVSRLTIGSLGTLGVLAEASVRLLPRPAHEISLVFEEDAAAALRRCQQWGGHPWPISATFWTAGRLTVRLSGVASAIAAARRVLGGELLEDGVTFWHSVREQTHPAFAGRGALWRLALPPATPPLYGEFAFEWGGGQRWLQSEAEPGVVRAAAAAAGGHAVLFRAPESLRCAEGTFAPLAPAMLALQRRLKKTFDPHGVFNPGRMYAEL